MSSIQVIGSIVDPLGISAKEVQIRLTAVTSKGSTPISAEATYVTVEGQYDFNVNYGVYRLEINYTDEYAEIKTVIIDEGTPSILSLLALIDYTPETQLTVVVPEDADWFELHRSLREDVDTTERIKTDTLAHLDTDATEVKHLIENDRTKAYMSEHNLIVHSGSISSYKQTTAYADDSGNTSVQDSKEVSADNASMRSSREMYNSSNGNSHTISKEEQNALRSSYTKMHKISDANITLMSELTSPSIDSVQTNVITEGDNTLTESVAMNGTSTGLVKESSINLKGLIHSFNIRSSQQGYVDTDDLVQVMQENGLKAYNKTLYEKQSIVDGTLSKIEKNPDIYDITDQNGASVFTVNTVTKQVNLNATLVLNNPDDFRGQDGSTVFDIYQYSSDNINYHDNFLVGDIYRRHNKSTDGVIGAWSTGYKITGVDGRDGDTYFNQYEYSTISPTGPWHDQYIDEDAYRRWRTISTGSAPTEWQVEVMKGTNGIEGEIVKPQYRYSTDGLEPWHTDFLSGDHYRQERYAYYSTKADFVANTPYTYTSWTSASKLVPVKHEDYFDGEKGKDGVEGSHGTGSFVVTLDNVNQIPSTNAGKDSDVSTISSRPAQDGDVITYQSTVSAAESDKFIVSYIRQESTWNAFALVVNGNQIVHGTIVAEALKSKSITTDQLAADNIYTGEIEATKLTFVEEAEIPDQINNSNAVATALKALSTITLVGTNGVVIEGNTITRSTNTQPQWTSQAYSKEAYAGGITATCTVDEGATGRFMFGLNSDPEDSDNFQSIDYAIYAQHNYVVFESGFHQGEILSTTPKSGDILSVSYDGVNIKYSINGVVLRTVEVEITTALAFDSLYVQSRCKLRNAQLVPSGNSKDVVDSYKIYTDAAKKAAEIVAASYADGIVTAEEQRAILDATTKANNAYNDAVGSYNLLPDAGFDIPFTEGLPVSFKRIYSNYSNMNTTPTSRIASDNWGLDYAGFTGELVQGAPISRGASQPYTEIVTDRISISEGDRVCFSAYTGAHRSRSVIFICFRSANGGLLQAVYGTDNTTADNKMGGSSLSDYKRIFAIGTAPVGTIFVEAYLRKYNGDSGSNDSFLFYVKPQFSLIAASITQPPIWVVGPKADSYPDQNQLQISGGGYNEDPTTGWGIHKDGGATFNSVTVRGHVEASSGSFTGAVTATSGSFAGDISGATGTFTGTVSADKLDADIVAIILKSQSYSNSYIQGKNSIRYHTIFQGNYGATLLSDPRTLSFPALRECTAETDDAGGPPGTEYVQGRIILQYSLNYTSYVTVQTIYVGSFAGVYDLDFAAFEVLINSNGSGNYRIRLTFEIYQGNDNSELSWSIPPKRLRLMLLKETSSLS